MTEPAFSPAAERNREPILDVLRQLLAPQGRALEIASGTGQHAAWFGAALPGWTWQPTDWRSGGFASITAHANQAGATNVQAPLLLDVTSSHWLTDAVMVPPNTQTPSAAAAVAPNAAEPFDLIYCANMLHIAPWACCAGLMQGSARHLSPGGCLVTYGPYLEDGVPTSDGNQSFDASLRAQNVDWGIRRREVVELEAARAGLQLAARQAMPANNLLLVWQREKRGQIRISDISPSA